MFDWFPHFVSEQGLGVVVSIHFDGGIHFLICRFCFLMFALFMLGLSKFDYYSRSKVCSVSQSSCISGDLRVSVSAAAAFELETKSATMQLISFCGSGWLWIASMGSLLLIWIWPCSLIE